MQLLEVSKALIVLEVSKAFDRVSRLFSVLNCIPDACGLCY